MLLQEEEIVKLPSEVQVEKLANSQLLADALEIHSLKYRDSSSQLMGLAGNMVVDGEPNTTFVTLKKGTERRSARGRSTDQILCKSVVQRLERENLPFMKSFYKKIHILLSKFLGTEKLSFRTNIMMLTLDAVKHRDNQIAAATKRQRTTTRKAKKKH